MKEQLITKSTQGLPDYREAMARVPEPSDIAAVQVGGQAPDCFGKLALVTKVCYRGTDIHGRAFVGYMCAMSERDTVENGCGCSNSMKQGELIRTVAISCLLNSAECDQLEEQMNAGQKQPCTHPSLDGFASNMANHPDKWYWCRECRHYINGRGQVYGQTCTTK